MVHTGLPKSPGIAIHVANKTFSIWKISLPCQWSIPKYPHFRIMASKSCNFCLKMQLNVHMSWCWWWLENALLTINFNLNGACVQKHAHLRARKLHAITSRTRKCERRMTAAMMVGGYYFSYCEFSTVLFALEMWLIKILYYNYISLYYSLGRNGRQPRSLGRGSGKGE